MKVAKCVNKARKGAMGLALTRDQVRRVDRVASEEYGISGLVLMENAGRNAGAVIRTFVHDLNERRAGAVKRVVVFCGSGNNGGDGLVVARHLDNWGVRVAVGLAGDWDRVSADAAVNANICEAMGISIEASDAVTIQPTDVVVDALLGTGFSGDVREPMAALIRRINDSEKAGVCAIDVPSGLDCDTGQPSGATVRADVTITFVADKVGFSQESARDCLGRVEVVEIGAPPRIIDLVVAC